MKSVNRFVLGLLALLFISELAFSSLAGLFGDTRALAQQASLDLGSMRLYLILLGLFDFAGFVLTLTTLFHFQYRQDRYKVWRLARRTAVLTGIYALFQASAGLWLLAENLQALYFGIAVVYTLLALIVWFLFAPTMARKSWPTSAPSV